MMARGAAGLAVIWAVTVAGCDEKYKPALTDPEVQRFEAQKDREVSPALPTLQVCGESITVDDIVRSPILYGYRQWVELGTYLKSIAQETTLDDFRPVAEPEVSRNVNYSVGNILLYQKAKAEAPDRKKLDEELDKIADQLWRQYVVEKFNGNEAEADANMAASGMDRKAYKDTTKRIQLTSYFQATKNPLARPISHREVVEYYQRLKATQFYIRPQITLRLIDIQPNRIETPDPNADRLQLARDLGADLVKRLEQGQDFAELAQKYSHEPLARQGGLWKPRDPNSMAPPYDVVAAKAMALTPGQVAGPIEVQDHVFIVRLEAKQDSRYLPLERVQALVEGQIRKDRYEQANVKLDADLAERSAVGDTTWFTDLCIREIYRRSLSPTPTTRVKTPRSEQGKP